MSALRVARRAAAAAVGLLAALAGAAASAEPPARRVLDDFEDVSGWTAHPADGVELAIGHGEGVSGRALRLDFRFVKGGGYAVARRALPLQLPGHYRFRFSIRGEAPVNHLEFKLIAPGMENVWWRVERDFAFPAEWRTVTIRDRHIEFAWGPAGGGALVETAALEIAITAGTGGAGSVWLDDLVLETLPPPAPLREIAAAASSEAAGAPAAAALDRDAATAWSPARADRAPALTLDLGGERELGGLVLRWAQGRHARDYDVALSPDGAAWTTVRRVRGGDGGDDFLHLPESEAAHLRVAVLAAHVPARGVALSEAAVQPLAFGASREAFFGAVARAAPRGRFPRALLGEQTYWTVFGLDAAPDEALFGEDGAIEAGKAEFSLEPFLHADGRLLAWSDAALEPGLERGALPMPRVVRRHGALALEVSAFADGAGDSAVALVRYAVRNAGASRARGQLFVAVRPFQVHPPQQFLNTRGGWAPVRALAGVGRTVRVNGVPRIASLTPHAGFGASPFDGGDITAALAEGRLPVARIVRDPFESASGALAYPYDLGPGESRTVDLLLALGGPRGLPAALPEAGDAAAWVEARRAAVARAWEEKLSRVAIAIPDTEVVRTMRAQIGWILVNRDGPAIQPGSRSYERSWIRDGALTSSALLRTGHAEAARAFVEWFAPHQYDDGKVPCCVDHRGSDPVPEHDSSGQLVLAVTEIVRFTGDLAFGARMWPRVEAAAGYLDSLRGTRRTARYRDGAEAHFFGLLPPSISHEGYSAKPMHSYWDDFFALKGFADAAWLADTLGRAADAARWAAVRDTFRRELVASIAASMRVHGIDFIPGAADLGDFDATSTAIALAPAGALDHLPRVAVERTFERYWTHVVERRDGVRAWDAMTPYEARNLGAFVRLGWRERAAALLAWLMTLRRPAGFAHWAEVVDREPRRVRFLGDMPHTWVGSDFVRSVLDMLAYERDDGAIVLGAGVPWDWLATGESVGVRGLPTTRGALEYAMRAAGDAVEVEIGPLARPPAAGLVVAPPARAPFATATVDGRAVALEADGSVRVRALPARVRFSP